MSLSRCDKAFSAREAALLFQQESASALDVPPVEVLAAEPIRKALKKCEPPDFVADGTPKLNINTEVFIWDTTLPLKKLPLPTTLRFENYLVPMLDHQS